MKVLTESPMINLQDVSFPDKCLLHKISITCLLVVSYFLYESAIQNVLAQAVLIKPSLEVSKFPVVFDFRDAWILCNSIFSKGTAYFIYSTRGCHP